MSSAGLVDELGRLGPVETLGRHKTFVVQILGEQLLPTVQKLIQNLGFHHLSAITGLDVGDAVELLYHFWRNSVLVTLRTKIPKTALTTASLVSLIPGAILYEMEVHDMLGVRFEGNPWMERKLLLPDAYPVKAPPPLRKEADPEQIRKMMELE
jgi:NADH:ubiquinone oxidoreductase subunit C